MKVIVIHPYYINFDIRALTPFPFFHPTFPQILVTPNLDLLFKKIKNKHRKKINATVNLLHSIKPIPQKP